MSHNSATLFFFGLTALVCVGQGCMILASDPATRAGQIDRVIKSEGKITLEVTIQGELDQPLNPQLSTGTSDSSQIMAPGGTTPSAQVTAGAPVKLIITRQGAAFRFTIGTVSSVTDKLHCTVTVDPATLGQTFQDPEDGNNLHKVREFLAEGAQVAIWGVSAN